MIKVLNISMGESLGGIEYLETQYQKLIKGVDVLTPIKLFDEKHYYDLNTSRKKIFGKIKYNYRLYKFLKNNKYDIIHINSSAFFFSFQVAFISRLCGIKKIISHSHNTPHISKIKSLLIKILNPLYRRMINICLSCSNTASKSLFTKTNDVIIINNGIDISKYKFNERIRKKYRKKLNIEEKQVYGHIGRFEKQKNHEFLLKVFYEIQKVNNNSILILVGDGKLKSQIEEKVNILGIKDKVLFLGFKKDVYKILNAIDVFIFPSLYEGLGIAVIESQTSGLPTFVSNGIPNDANISKNFHKIDSYDAIEWKNIILNEKIYSRKSAYKDAVKSGYDIKQTTKKLEKIYKDLIK